MITVAVKASRNYNIYIENGLLPKAGQLVRQAAGGQKAFLITDSNVDPLHGAAAVRTLEETGYEVIKHVFPAGEESKNLTTLSEILSAMAAAHMSRKDIAVALGGGVVGDITGFAAAVYMRGIQFVQIPTTVLAAVDSSVGGKTAVDLPEGKNLAGAFHQPSAVIFDGELLKTLPERDYNNGFAEVIKYGMIEDPSIFELLESPEENLDQIIQRCVEIKAQIVEEDEFESGKRQILNFGHSIGHAYEKLSDFSMLHGEAVACGMMEICRIAEKQGSCEEGLALRLGKLLKQFKLPLQAGYDPDEVVEVMANDKKASGDSINLIVPLEAGRVEIVKTGLDELVSMISV